MHKSKLHIQQQLFCRSRCGFYGNPQWDGYCSKCHRGKNISFSSKPKRLFARTSVPSKNRSTKSRDNANAEVKNTRAYSNRTAVSSQSDNSRVSVAKRPLKSPVVTTLRRWSGGNEPSHPARHLGNLLDLLPFSAAELVRRQLKMCSNACVGVSCDNDAVVEELADIVQSFYTNLEEQLDVNPVLHAVAIHHESIRDLTERYICSQQYRRLFVPLSHRLEHTDLALQSKIRSLHWVSPQLLDVNIDESSETVLRLLDNSITALIEIDSKKTPQDKLACISSSIDNLLHVLRASSVGRSAMVLSRQSSSHPLSPSPRPSTPCEQPLFYYHSLPADGDVFPRDFSRGDIPHAPVPDGGVAPVDATVRDGSDGVSPTPADGGVAVDTSRHLDDVLVPAGNDGIPTRVDDDGLSVHSTDDGVPVPEEDTGVPKTTEDNDISADDSHGSADDPHFLVDGGGVPEENGLVFVSVNHHGISASDDDGAVPADDSHAPVDGGGNPAEDDALFGSGGRLPPSADELLPAVILLVLRSNPPRLQSNLQFVTLFSSQPRIMTGQQGYYFTNLAPVLACSFRLALL